MREKISELGEAEGHGLESDRSLGIVLAEFAEFPLLHAGDMRPRLLQELHLIVDLNLQFGII